MSDQLTPEEIKRLKAIVSPPRSVRNRIRVAFVVFIIFTIVIVMVALVSMAQPLHIGVFTYTLGN